MLENSTLENVAGMSKQDNNGSHRFSERSLKRFCREEGILQNNTPQCGNSTPFINSCHGGWEIFTRNGEEARNWGVDLIMKFFRSLYVVGRGLLVPYCMKSPLYWLPSFSYFVQYTPTLPYSLSPSTPTLTILSVVLFLWLNG